MYQYHSNYHRRNAETYFPFQLSVYYIVFRNVRMIIDPMYLLVVAGMNLHNKTSLILCHQTLCPLNGRCGDMILIMNTMKRLRILESKVIIII